MKKKLTAAKTDHNRTILQRHTDRLVYERYGLTKEEIKIVERK